MCNVIILMQKENVSPVEILSRRRGAARVLFFFDNASPRNRRLLWTEISVESRGVVDRSNSLINSRANDRGLLARSLSRRGEREGYRVDVTQIADDPEGSFLSPDHI